MKQKEITVYNENSEIITAFLTENIMADVHGETIFPKGAGWFFTVKGETIIKKSNNPAVSGWLLKRFTPNRNILFKSEGPGNRVFYLIKFTLTKYYLEIVYNIKFNVSFV